MIYSIQNCQHKARFAETPVEGLVQIPARGEVLADLDPDSVKKLIAQGFKLGPSRMAAPQPEPVPAPVPLALSLNVKDSGDLGAVNAGKLKKSKAKKDDFLLDYTPGEPGQE